MKGKHSGKGLMTAGAIVSLVGIGIVMLRVLEIPRYWIPLLVGVAIFLFGALRWAASREE